MYFFFKYFFSIFFFKKIVFKNIFLNYKPSHFRLKSLFLIHWLTEPKEKLGSLMFSIINALIFICLGVLSKWPSCTASIRHFKRWAGQLSKRPSYTASKYPFQRSSRQLSKLPTKTASKEPFQGWEDQFSKQHTMVSIGIFSKLGRIFLLFFQSRSPFFCE